MGHSERIVSFEADPMESESSMREHRPTHPGLLNVATWEALRESLLQIQLRATLFTAPLSRPSAHLPSQAPQQSLLIARTRYGTKLPKLTIGIISKPTLRVINCTYRKAQEATSRIIFTSRLNKTSPIRTKHASLSRDPRIHRGRRLLRHLTDLRAIGDT